jgi:hypothetical protein
MFGLFRLPKTETAYETAVLYIADDGEEEIEGSFSSITKRRPTYEEKVEWVKEELDASGLDGFDLDNADYEIQAVTVEVKRTRWF